MSDIQDYFSPASATCASTGLLFGKHLFIKQLLKPQTSRYTSGYNAANSYLRELENKRNYLSRDRRSPQETRVKLKAFNRTLRTIAWKNPSILMMRLVSRALSATLGYVIGLGLQELYRKTQSNTTDQN